MTTFETISVLIAVAALAIAAIGIPTFVLMWSQASDVHRDRFRKTWSWIGQKAYRGWAYISGLVLVARGIWEMVQFAIDPTAPTRMDIINHEMNLFSLCVFSAVTIGMFVFFTKVDQKNRETTANEQAA
jgi:hypothetical protein